MYKGVSHMLILKEKLSRIDNFVGLEIKKSYVRQKKDR